MKLAFSFPSTPFGLAKADRTALTSRRCKLRPSKNHRKRQRSTICAVSDPLEDLAGPARGLTYDEITTDDEYVVLEGKDVIRLIEEMEKEGIDSFSSGDDDDRIADDFLTFAEKRMDEWNRQGSTATTEDEKAISEDKDEADVIGRDEGVGMQYFKDDHVQFMPSWAAKAYESGEHVELFDDASRTWPLSSGQRLHDIIARKTATVVDGKAKGKVGMDGIVDCTVADVAEDYSIPVEFVVDAMLHFGVPVPIRPDQSIRDSMTTEEVENLLTLITSFDAQDLRDRYSDNSIEEVADNYGLPVDRIVEVCEREGLYICRNEKTRLSTIREDRVLDIILKGALTGQPYPPLLEGLVTTS